MGRLYRRLIRGTDLFYLLLCLTCAGLSVAVLASWCMFMQNNTDGQVNYKVAIVQAAAAGLGPEEARIAAPGEPALHITLTETERT